MNQSDDTGRVEMSMAHVYPRCAVMSHPHRLPRTLVADDSGRDDTLLPSIESFKLICPCSGHALRRQTAGQFGPDLAKKLAQLVKMEKNVMRSMELVGRERMEVAVCSRFMCEATIP